MKIGRLINNAHLNPEDIPPANWVSSDHELFEMNNPLNILLLCFNRSKVKSFLFGGEIVYCDEQIQIIAETYLEEIEDELICRIYEVNKNTEDLITTTITDFKELDFFQKCKYANLDFYYANRNIHTLLVYYKKLMKND